MRIAHFISHFPYREQFSNPYYIENYVCSGGEIAAYKIVSELSKLGIEVVVYTSSVENRDSVEYWDGFSVFRYRSRGKVGETRFSPGLFYKPLYQISNFDLIHIHHTTPPGGAAGLNCALRLKKPLIVTHHGFEKFDNYGSLLRRLSVFLSANLYVDYLLKQSSSIICISPTFINQSRFLSKYIKKVSVIPNGIDLKEFNCSIPKETARDTLGLPKNRPIILYLGSLIPPKGVDVFLDAFQKVIRTIPNALAVIVGRGGLETSLKNKCTDLSLSNNVLFKGFVGENEKKLLYYRACDVFVMPSYLSEMFPITLLESSAAGCALVTSDLETFKWFIKDHENGLITQAKNAGKLAHGILEIIQNSNLQQKLSVSANQRAYKFSWESIANQTSSLYGSIISEYHNIS